MTGAAGTRSNLPPGRSLGRRIVALFVPYRGRVLLVLVVIVVSSALSVVGALLIKVVFDKALFPPGGPNISLLGGVRASGPYRSGA